MIFGCALKDAIIARALEGDRDAILRLARLSGRDLPLSERVAARTDAIRRMAAQVRHAMPGATDRRIATILALAGGRIQAGHGLDGNQFAGLATAERAWLEADIRKVLEWAPRRPDGDGWLRLRQIQTLIAE